MEFSMVPSVRSSQDNPLHRAAVEGNVRAAEALLDVEAVSSALVDAVKSDGMTSLSMAVMMGREEVVRVLLEQGADVDKCNVVPLVRYKMSLSCRWHQWGDTLAYCSFNGISQHHGVVDRARCKC